MCSVVCCELPPFAQSSFAFRGEESELADAQTLSHVFLNRFCVSSSILRYTRTQGGGRMSTSRGPGENQSSVDLGAQYITATPEYRQKHSQLYDELLSKGVLSPLTGKIEGDKSVGVTHYMIPAGSGSLVKYFIQKSGVEVKPDHQVTSIGVEGGDKGRVSVGTAAGVRGQFDAVLLTMPTPQILQLQGGLQTILASKSEERKRLEAVRYSSRFCLGLFYKPGVQLDVPWSSKYIQDHPCLRFVSIDNKKRGLESLTTGPSVVVHTSVPYGVKNLERDKDEIKSEIYNHFREMFPDFPQPDHIKGHKWRYSQVSQGYEGAPGCVILQEDPFIICGGDGFVHSNFDGCISSTEEIVKAFVKEQKRLKGVI